MATIERPNPVVIAPLSEGGDTRQSGIQKLDTDLTAAFGHLDAHETAIAGKETPTGAQEKADAAQTAAINITNNVNVESTGYGVISGLQVTAQSIPDMTVQTSIGTAHMPDGKRFDVAATTQTINTADTTNPRIDLIYINSSGVISCLTGTVAASPVAPTLPGGGLALANIAVTAGVTSIISTNITDLRVIKDSTFSQYVKVPKVADVITKGPWVDVRAFGAKGDGKTDDTIAIKNAINSNLSIFFPNGIYLTDEITIPSSFSGNRIFGHSLYHYSNVKGVVIKAKTTGQNSIFKLSNGADNITFRTIRIDGDNKSQKCIDATYGAFLSLEQVGVYNSLNYGVYCKQGLGRYQKCFFSNAGVGLHLYSDSSVTDCEFTGGTIPLKIVAGGNRLVNVWANSSSDSNIVLTPFDSSTTHINTSMVNIYAGEVFAGTTQTPVIKIQGLPSQKVQQVQFSNSHLVCASTSSDHINGGILCDYVIDSVFTNVDMIGFGSYATSTRYTDYYAKTTNSDNINFNNFIAKSNNKSPIWIDSGSSQIKINNATFDNWGYGVASGAENAAIRITDNSAIVDVSECTFSIRDSRSAPYALDGQSGDKVLFVNNSINYPNATIANLVSGSLMGTYRVNGVAYYYIKSASVSGGVNKFTQNYAARGQVTAAGGATATLFTLPTLAENQSYKIMVMQSGTGANGTTGTVFAYNGALGAITEGNTNTNAALQNQIKVSGNTVQLLVGSGYGSTTWDWSYFRIG